MKGKEGPWFWKSCSYIVPMLLLIYIPLQDFCPSCYFTHSSRNLIDFLHLIPFIELVIFRITKALESQSVLCLDWTMLHTLDFWHSTQLNYSNFTWDLSIVPITFQEDQRRQIVEQRVDKGERLAKKQTQRMFTELRELAIWTERRVNRRFKWFKNKSDCAFYT